MKGIRQGTARMMSTIEPSPSSPKKEVTIAKVSDCGIQVLRTVEDGDSLMMIMIMMMMMMGTKLDHCW